MKTTGVCPRENAILDSSPAKIGRRRLSVCGLAVTAMLLGSYTPASAEIYDPTLPRVEKVLDTDGSVWEVLIVPRPLYRPAPPHHIVVPDAAPTPNKTKADVPPAPMPKGEKKTDAKKKPMPMPKEKPAKKKPAQAKEAKSKSPAKAEKANSQPLHDTKVIAFQPEDTAKTKADKSDAKKPEAKKPAKDKADSTDHPFGVEIVPRFSYPIHAPSAACCPPAGHPTHVNPEDYSYVYQSIPFLRSEYIANPSYRHEATMQILFGELRPSTAVEKTPRPRQHGTMFPFENDYITPYSYYSLGDGSGYGRGPLPFAAPGAYGVNYNFYYPMPTVYRSY